MVDNIKDVKYLMKLHDKKPITKEDIQSISRGDKDPLKFTLSSLINYLHVEDYSSDYLTSILKQFDYQNDCNYVVQLINNLIKCKQFADTPGNRDIISSFQPTKSDDIISELEFINSKRFLKICINNCCNNQSDADQFYYGQMVRLTPIVEDLDNYINDADILSFVDEQVLI